MVEQVISWFATLFVIVDPIGILPIFISVTVGMTPNQRVRTALLGCLLAAIILTLFVLLGDAILARLGIGLPAFRIAGGILLFWISFQMVFEKRRRREKDSEVEKMGAEDIRSIAAFPIAVPLLSGPGSITAAMLLAAPIKGDSGSMMMLLATIVVLYAISALVLAGSPIVDKILGSTVRAIISRLFGVLLAAMAIQFIVDGIGDIIRAF